MLGFIRILWRRSEGAAAIEFALVCIPLLLITIGIMEFAFALFQWNAAEKATQMGARMAVVSTPVAGGLNTFNGKIAGIEFGDPAAVFSTGGATVICTGDGSSGNCTNVLAGIYGGAYLPAVHNRIINKMREIFPRIAADNVAVEYGFINLGFAGRPCGPVPSVTVRLQNMSFDFIVIDALLNAFFSGGGFASSLAMPDFTATLVGEDLNTFGNTAGNPTGPTCL